jgi:predicted DNA-binding WGR domain protein
MACADAGRHPQWPQVAEVVIDASIRTTDFQLLLQAAMLPVTLQRMDPTKYVSRCSRLDVQPEVCALWCLVRAWGRIGSPGRMMQPFPTHTAAAAEAVRLHKRKTRRGYR